MTRDSWKPVTRLRIAALAEGVSFIVLLGVAMPLKYLAGMPMAVKVVGWAHGVLFILFCIALALAALSQRWGIGRTGLIFLAGLVPFGPFLLDKSLREPVAHPS